MKDGDKKIILGINTTNDAVTATLLEVDTGKKAVVKDYQLWVGKQLQYIPGIIEQLQKDYAVNTSVIIKNEYSEKIIEYLSWCYMVGHDKTKLIPITFSTNGDDEFNPNLTKLVQFATQLYVKKELIIPKEHFQLDEFFQDFSTNAAKINKTSIENIDETSFVWSFLLACYYLKSLWNSSKELK